MKQNFSIEFKDNKEANLFYDRCVEKNINYSNPIKNTDNFLSFYPDVENKKPMQPLNFHGITTIPLSYPQNKLQIYKLIKENFNVDMEEELWVECIEKGEKALTEGKKYKVYNEDSKYYYIINDNNNKNPFYKKRFKIVPNPNKKENMKTYTVTRKFIGEIHSMVCDHYKTEIMRAFNPNFHPFADDFQVSEEQLQKWLAIAKNEKPEVYKILIEKFPDAEKKNSRWVPKIGDTFYNVNDRGGINKSTHSGYNFDLDIIDNFGAFQTKEEAELEAKKILIRRKYVLFSKEKNSDKKFDWYNINYKWGIEHTEKALRTNFYYSLNPFIAGVAFHSEQDAKDALKEFGDDLKLLVEYC